MKCPIEWRDKNAARAETETIKIGPHRCNKNMGHKGKCRCACKARSVRHSRD